MLSKGARIALFESGRIRSIRLRAIDTVVYRRRTAVPDSAILTNIASLAPKPVTPAITIDLYRQSQRKIRKSSQTKRKETSKRAGGNYYLERLGRSAMATNENTASEDLHWFPFDTFRLYRSAESLFFTEEPPASLLFPYIPLPDGWLLDHPGNATPPEISDVLAAPAFSPLSLEQAQVSERGQSSGRGHSSVYSSFPKSFKRAARSNLLAASGPGAAAPVRLRSQVAEQVDLEVKGSLGGKQVSAYPDTGSGSNLISQAYAQRRKIPINHSMKKRKKLANGKSVHTLGTATLPFKFWGETEFHNLIFDVLPRCAHDVILGTPFLRLTKTFEQFGHRVKLAMRKVMSYRVWYVGGHQRKLQGWLDDEWVETVADTGSDVNLVSREYAIRRGISINTDKELQLFLELGDNSSAYTSGAIDQLHWSYDELGGPSYNCPFYVLDGLPCDVMFSKRFLLETGAFTRYSECMPESDPYLESIDESCALSIVRIGLSPLEKLIRWMKPEKKRREDDTATSNRTPEQAWQSAGKLR